MIRRILEAIHEKEFTVKPEFQKGPSKKLMDEIGELLDTEVIAINDFSKPPVGGANPVEFPGNTTLYSIGNPQLYNEVANRVQTSGVWWVNDMNHNRFNLSPMHDTSVAEFWQRIRDLATWFVAKVGEMGDPNISTSGETGITTWSWGKGHVLMGFIDGKTWRVDIWAPDSSAIDNAYAKVKPVFEWMRKNYGGEINLWNLYPDPGEKATAQKLAADGLIDNSTVQGDPLPDDVQAKFKSMFEPAEKTPAEELDYVTIDWLIENVELNSDDAVFDLRHAQDAVAKHTDKDSDEALAEITVGDVWDMLSDDTHTAVQLAWAAHKQSNGGG